jgi:hypothetical protein
VRSSHSHFVKASGLRWLAACCWSRSRGQNLSGPCHS